MLRGQALRSLENADSTKFLQKQDGEKLEDSRNALQDVGGETSRKKSIAEENGFKESNVPLKLTAFSAGANATISATNAVPNVKIGDSIVSKFAAQPQKNLAFRMSANEDFPESDDETYTNGFVSASSGGRREELQTLDKSVSPQAIALEKISAKAEAKIPENLASTSTNNLNISGALVAAKENIGIQTPVVVAPISNFQQDINVQSTSVVNKSVPSRDVSSSPTLSGPSSKNVDTLPSSGGTLFATTNAGSNSFGFSSSLASSSPNDQSQVSLPGFGSSSAVGSQLPPTTGAPMVTQSLPFQFGSSGSSTIFGTSGTPFSTNISVTGSSAPPENLFGSGSTNTLSATTSSPFSNTPNSSSSATSSIFSSSWQTSKSPVMGSAASSPSPSTLFSFGASQTASATSSIPTLFGQSTGTSSVSTFSFTSPTATTSSMPSLSQSKPVFGSTTALRSPGNSGDQMNMEDSMAEDPVHSSNPSVPVFGQPFVSSSNPTVPAFGQPLVSPSPPGFMFGSTAPSSSLSASPFQFGGQQNQATSQNLTSFQASSSLDFNSGGSFSLGSGGGEKGARKMVRVSKNKNRRK